MKTTELFNGSLIKNTAPTDLMQEVTRLILLAHSTLGHTKPSEENLAIQVEIVMQDLSESFPYIHLTELPHIFKLGIRHELSEYTIFAPVEVYKWCKAWYNHPERSKAREMHFKLKKNLIEAPKPEQICVDYDKWERDALANHRAGRKQLGGLNFLYEHLVSQGKITKLWPEFRKVGKMRMENELLAGKTSMPIQLREEIAKADTATDGRIKSECIELALDAYFSELNRIENNL